VPQLTISEVARQVGLQPSAIRYYEKIGLLPPAHRMSGQRRYDTTVLYRLAVIQRARQSGFTLDEIRRLFFGFRGGTRASERWEQLSQKTSRARRSGGWDNDDAGVVEGDDEELPLRHS
jgi:DNA-binding transcriptional MerR regulator